MPEPYTITGTVTLPEGVEHAGIRIQAFDRDLPSLERRRGSAPQLLGEAIITDIEGRFRITYTLEQFQSGEKISLDRKIGEKNADLSFLVFDGTGQALNIQYIEALERKYPSDQIIHNARTILENVNIFVDAPRESDASEYEKLIAQIAPVAEDLPLVELTDEDVAFLINELGFEEKSEDEQHLKWLRQCALLAQESNLPIEAFYGWGRKGLPAQLSELEMLDLPEVLEKLTGLRDDELREALFAAIAANIIPARFRERTDAIAHMIHRRAQKEMTVRLRLERDPTGAPLVGYTITAFDIDTNNRDLGTDVTDALGEFVVAYYVDAVALDSERQLHFLVRGPTLTDEIEVTKRIRPDASEYVSVRVTLPGMDPTLEQFRKDKHIDVQDEVLEMLKKSHGIKTLADIRRIGGLSRIAEVRVLDSDAMRRLDALADLDRLSRALNETTVLFDHHYESVFAIAEVSRSEFVASISAKEVGISERRATELHIAAKAQTDILDQIFAGIAIDFANGIRPTAGYAAGDYFPPFPEEQAND
jgi:hypothetical protein